MDLMARPQGRGGRERPGPRLQEPAAVNRTGRIGRSLRHGLLLAVVRQADATSPFQYRVTRLLFRKANRSRLKRREKSIRSAGTSIEGTVLATGVHVNISLSPSMACS